MQQAAGSAPGATSGGDTAKALEILRQAAAQSRALLDPAELPALLSALGIALDPAPELARSAAPLLRIGLRHTREFGAVISAGFGGADAELDQASFRRDCASVHAAVELTDAPDFLRLFTRTLAYRQLARAVEHGRGASPDPMLLACFEALLALGRRYSASNPDAPLMLHALELDPVEVGERLLARGARCELGPAAARPLPRPVHKIDQLLHPASIGIIGVSASAMNFGRIILRNLMGSGYPKERLLIVRPGETEIDGVRCVPRLGDLDQELDLLIVAVAADAVYALVDEIIASRKVASVMLIPGSLGETRASKEPAAAMAARINAAHAGADGGPIFLGANCLGVVSHPAPYDSWFIPLERLPKPKKKPERNSVMLSQSGAFMITRMSQNPWLDPRYMIATGNQTDLTHGDLLGYFAERPEIETIGMYIEGFKDLDGLDFAKAVRRAVLGGKQVVVYKAGRTGPGTAGVAGHTASIAGAAAIFDSVVRHAGAIVAEDFTAFDDLFYIAGALHRKRISGTRLGAISGAGFEAVGMADSIAADHFTMEVGVLQPDTVKRLEEILVAKKLSALVEIRNPIDINPGADDEAHLQITEAFLQDSGIDAVVVALDPTAPAVRALEESRLRPGFDLNDPKSTVHLMPPIVERNDKPVVGIIDAGGLYDAMAARLMDQGVCVFRNCGRGTRALVRYVEARLYAQALRERS